MGPSVSKETKSVDRAPLLCLGGQHGHQKDLVEALWEAKGKLVGPQSSYESISFLSAVGGSEVHHTRRRGGSLEAQEPSIPSTRGLRNAWQTVFVAGLGPMKQW